MTLCIQRDTVVPQARAERRQYVARRAIKNVQACLALLICGCRDKYVMGDAIHLDIRCDITKRHAPAYSSPHGVKGHHHPWPFMGDIEKVRLCINRQCLWTSPRMERTNNWEAVRVYG